MTRSPSKFDRRRRRRRKSDAGAEGYARLRARARQAGRIVRRALVALGIAYLILAWRVLDRAVVPLDVASADGASLLAASFWGLGAVVDTTIVAGVLFVAGSAVVAVLASTRTPEGWSR